MVQHSRIAVLWVKMAGMDEINKAADNCCLDSVQKINGMNTMVTGNYFGFDDAEPDGSFCMPNDISGENNHMVAKYKDTNNDDIYIVCVGGTPGAADTTNAAYPSGQKKTCSTGHYVLVNGTSYNTPKYTTDKDGNPIDLSSVDPYPTQFYRQSNYSESTDNTCTMNTDGTWPSECGEEPPAAWLIKY